MNCSNCGKRASKNSPDGLCKKCSTAKRIARALEAQAIVDKGVCPTCGSPLRRNLALTGWYQCARFGEPAFRAPAFRDLPKCSWQVIVDVDALRGVVAG
jgi:predicted nucleic acid-binding Zn ribbon protein